VQRASHIQCGCFIRIHRRMFAPEVNGRVNRNVIELRFTDAGIPSHPYGMRLLRPY
jgi:hypothetical protein